MNYGRILLPRRLIGRDVIAVDLATDNLKIAHATGVVPGKVSVAGLVSRNIQGLSDEAISGLVGACVAEMNVRNPSVITVVPSHLSITRTIEVPSLDEDELRDIVNLQASRHTPYSMEDIIVDYVDLGIYKGTYTRVLLVVVSHDKIKRQLDILEDAGLRVERVLFGAEVVSRIFPVMFQSVPSASPEGIIHVDEAFTDFLVTADAKPIFIRNIPIGAGHLADDQGGHRARFAEEVRKSLDVYRSEEIEKDPGTFVLTGAVEDMADLKPVLDDALKVPAEIVSYSRHLSLSDEATETILAEGKLSFLGIISSLYAYRDAKLDLVPEEVKSRMQFEERTRHIVKTGILAIIILFLITAILFNKIFSKTIYLQTLTSEYRSDVDKAGCLEEDEAKVKRVERFLAGRHYCLDVLTELHGLVPGNVELNDIRVFGREGKFSVKGVAKSRSSLSILIDHMGESGSFDKVKVPRAVERDDPDRYVDFEIRCVLVKKAGTE